MKEQGNQVDNHPGLRCFLISLFLLFQLYLFGINTDLADTSSINSLTSQAYNLARINPSLSITNAHKALSLSQNQNYEKGIADANLALGAAFLAKYNPGDSATYYFNQALNKYGILKDWKGLGRVCYGFAFLYSFAGNLQKAMEFGERSIQYFEEIGQTKELNAALSALIYLERQAGNHAKALSLSEKAIKTAQLATDTSQWANALNDQGQIFKDMFLFNQAIDSYFKAFRLWEEKNDSAGLAIAYGSIANTFFYQEDFQKSLEFNLKKLEIVLNSANQWETNKTLNNIAMSYSNLGQHDKALSYMRQSLELALKSNYSDGIAMSYDKMASAFLKMGEADSAFLYSSKSVNIARKNSNKALASYLVNLADAQKQQKQFNKALLIAQEAHSLAKQNNDQQTLLSSSFLLSEIYSNLKRKDLAYPFLIEYLKLNDSINNKTFIRKVTRLDLQHEYDKKQSIAQHKIDLLDKDNQIKTESLQKTWTLFAALLLLTMALTTISLLTIRNKNHRIEQMNLEIRNYLLQLDKLKTEQKDENPVTMLVENYGLTQREAEIMELIATGIGNEEIAEKLFVSKNTIKFHIKNIFIKLDVRNRVQALQKMAG